MRRYHHIGIPHYRIEVWGDPLEASETLCRQSSEKRIRRGVEWMRFEADAAVPDLVRRVAHVAFEVTDLSSELAGREILIPPNSPSDGVRVAFIIENGAPIELLEFTDPKHPARLSNQLDE
jgi:hypothetical protein